jgi:hypothetical protein
MTRIQVLSCSVSLLNFTAALENVFLYHHSSITRIVNFLDDEGNIIIPKEVRPIIDHGTTFLGNKKGAIRQFRYGNLHIREYRTHYSVHSDTVDPRIDPMGHLMLDSPELKEGILRLAKVAKKYLNAKKC